MKLAVLLSVQLTLCGGLLVSSGARARGSKAADGLVASLPAETVLDCVLLPARVNDSERLWFVLDSGAGSGLIVDRRRAEVLKLEMRGRAKSTGAGENFYDVTFAENTRVTLGRVRLPPQTARVVSLSSLEPVAGRALDGAIGFGFFSRYVVEVDYAARRVNLYEPRAYRYNGSGTRLPLVVEDNHFFVSARVALPGRGPVEGKFMVDTGAGLTTLILNRPFVESHHLLASLGKRILDRSLPGLGGETKLLLGRAETIQLGGLTIRRPTVTLSQDAKGSLASPEFDGVIGGELLRRFKVIFDSAGRRLILEPNAHFDEPYEHNMSGLGLRAEGKGFGVVRIHRVVEDSPATEAGLREGDVILAVGGRPAPSLEQLYRMFKQEGREFDLDVLRGGERLRVKLRLRRLA